MGQLKKKGIEPDPRYNNIIVSRFTNYLMKGGKKATARRVIYGTFEIIQKKTKKEPIEIFEQAIQNASPILEVRSKRIGGAKYQVPVEVSKNRRVALAMRWIIGWKQPKIREKQLGKKKMFTEWQKLIKRSHILRGKYILNDSL